MLYVSELNLFAKSAFGDVKSLKGRHTWNFNRQKKKFRSSVPNGNEVLRVGR